uniref:Uncharacterized protein n=1 Tax=Anopheles dirus TaxID=7168 RepID=A0A182MZM3_9DIPT
MKAFVRLMVAAAVLLCLLPVIAGQTWIDRDKTYCEHIDCTKLAKYKGEKFCSPCDTRHYCECKEVRESLPYLGTCPGSGECQKTDSRGKCEKTLHNNLCSLIDKPYM